MVSVLPAERAFLAPWGCSHSYHTGKLVGGWQPGCNRQISCLCVFATPLYKGKHNLKYDYLVL